MILPDKFVVSTEKNNIYSMLKNFIPSDDYYMHYRLEGKAINNCNDIFFVIHNGVEAMSRMWMCYGKHDNAVANWGAVFTDEKYRNQGLCRKLLDYCFKYIDNINASSPTCLLCTAGTLELTNLYKKYGFLTAINGWARGPLYRPIGNSPATFEEFCNQYYTETQSLHIVDADFNWRNEIDCLLKFAFFNLNIKFGFNDVECLSELLLKNPQRAKIILSNEEKCVGWIVDNVIQLHPNYINVPFIF